MPLRYSSRKAARYTLVRFEAAPAINRPEHARDAEYRLEHHGVVRAVQVGCSGHLQMEARAGGMGYDQTDLLGFVGVG